MALAANGDLYLALREGNAILRIGAVQEGTFRKHFICDSGRVRDTIYFSILDTEWPAVKQKLTKFMALDRQKFAG